MKRFSFRLDSVLRLRAQEEQRALQAMGEAQARLRDSQIHRENLLKNRESSLQRRSELSSNGSPTSFLQIEDQFIEGMKVWLLQASHQIKRAEKSLEKARQNYQLAKRKLRSIEKLREKAVEEYKKEKLKWETKQLEELYVIRSHFKPEWDSDEQDSAEAAS